MATYRLPEFNVEQRAEAALQMLVPLPDRPWGLVSELADRYGVSRTRLYELRDQVWESVITALQPPSRRVGQPPRRP